jgi:hypothetical protein
VKGARVTVTCKGGGCPKRKLTIVAKRATVHLRSFTGRPLRPGAKLAIRVDKPEYRRVIYRLTVRSRKAPALVKLCQDPGAKPARCG